MDFTIIKYIELINSLIEQEYSFQTFRDFLSSPKIKVIILRHDVDLMPESSLRFAEIQYALGIKGTYYFRNIPQSWNRNIVTKIAQLGHEIGYHYESVDFIKKQMKRQGKRINYDELIDLSYQDFNTNLLKMRKIIEIDTVCMHGSPMSKFDNREIWKKYDYKHLEILGEPYFDINFDEVFYLTDTGRCWNGSKVSVRDKVRTNFNLNYHKTDEIISAARKGILPDRIMFTFHPQRWHDKKIYWIKELITQNLKNIIKKYAFVKE